MNIKNPNCPGCGTEVMFDDFHAIEYTEANPNAGEYIEHCAYKCPNCGGGFMAKIIYSLRVQRVEEF